MLCHYVNLVPSPLLSNNHKRNTVENFSKWTRNTSSPTTHTECFCELSDEEETDLDLKRLKSCACQRLSRSWDKNLKLQTTNNARGLVRKTSDTPNVTSAPSTLTHCSTSAKCPFIVQILQWDTPSKPRYLIVFLSFSLRYKSKIVVALEGGGSRTGQRNTKVLTRTAVKSLSSYRHLAALGFSENKIHLYLRTAAKKTTSKQDVL